MFKDISGVSGISGYQVIAEELNRHIRSRWWITSKRFPGVSVVFRGFNRKFWNASAGLGDLQTRFRVMGVARGGRGGIVF